MTRDHVFFDPPAISDGVVVWTTVDEDIHGWRLSTASSEFVVCDALGSQSGPAISGRYVVWQDDRNGKVDIYGYDLKTREEFVVCDAPGNQWWPAISGEVVIWADWRNDTTADVWGKNMESGREFKIASTSNAKEALHVDISGDVVVWQDGRKINAMRLKSDWMASQ